MIKSQQITTVQQCKNITKFTHIYFLDLIKKYRKAPNTIKIGITYKIPVKKIADHHGKLVAGLLYNAMQLIEILITATTKIAIKHINDIFFAFRIVFIFIVHSSILIVYLTEKRL